MRKTQLIAVLILAFLLVGYGIYVKLSEEFNFNFTFNTGPQFYSSENPPDQIYFAGETVPLEDKKVSRRFAKELKSQTYWHPARAVMLDRAHFWLPHITAILKQYKVPEDLKYLAVVESGLQNVDSPKNAGGFWQIIPQTARNYGLVINDEVDERYHPLLATQAACRYLQSAHLLFSSWTNAAASYNAGINGMTQAMLRQRKSSFYQLKLNQQTTDYIFRILAVKQLVEHPKEYGYKVSRHSTLNSRIRMIKVNKSIPNLTAFAQQYGITYQTLRSYNPWIKKNTLTIKKKSYILLIPRKNTPKPPLRASKPIVPETTGTASSKPKESNANEY
ncbi:lytic transglycosylase domain-containing protein [Xanthocytophaga agilis]|uniref:Lytic transglycosylase domain-containing protein n=1 Tax=Xanthocytophaga agilis TaxID=3048010 RepID=A0AAE3UFH3_9BACT|nr:lytic transglycosylase domain-containing protein [Xanthocytophaga agilis]MDJ1503250.1 lytic transglycosylase domain-containing protein [Xanthocytophaga agilis]